MLKYTFLKFLLTISYSFFFFLFLLQDPAFQERKELQRPISNLRIKFTIEKSTLNIRWCYGLKRAEYRILLLFLFICLDFSINAMIVLIFHILSGYELSMLKLYSQMFLKYKYYNKFISSISLTKLVNQLLCRLQENFIIMYFL